MDLEINVDSGEVTATRRVGRSGNSTVVRIPPALLEVAEFEVGDEVEVRASADGVITVADADG
jgi:antitoxin component of MazEF toxin-antitoxin module